MSVRTFTDQLSSQVIIPCPPQRIISLVPSQTELLADLGLNDRVVGITKFCVHPPSWLKTKTIVGGTKNLQMDSIESLKPDLIIGNKEDIERLRTKYPVWMSDIIMLSDALQMIREIGSITGTEKRAEEIISEIKSKLRAMTMLPPLRTLYLIWRNPWMAAAPGTFIHEMLQLSGLENSIRESTRYPELTGEEIKLLNPELILLTSEPYPFKQQHIAEISVLCPDASIRLIDGEMFSWYGSRMKLFVGYVDSLRTVLQRSRET
jgi:ABC-type Fe3+-hydroxamate transport system substrate-binding protein